MSVSWRGLIALCLFGCAGSSLAGRPLTVDDAGPAAVGTVEVECGWAHEEGSGNRGSEISAGLTFGLLSGVEIGVGAGVLRIRENDATESGASDSVIAAKWQLHSGTHLMPRQALAPSVKFPTADEDKGLGSGKTDADLTWIASWSFMDALLGFHLNAGYSWIGEPAGEEVGDVVHSGAALECCIMERLQWVGELFIEDERECSADRLVMLRTGFRWEIGSLTFDIASGVPVDGDGPDYMMTIGLTAVY